MDSLIARWKGNSRIDHAGPVREDDVAGGKAFRLECGGPCAQSELSCRRSVQMECLSVQGAAAATIAIFAGDQTPAKTMLADSPARIGKLDLSKFVKR